MSSNLGKLMQDFLHHSRDEKLAAAWFLQPREEQRRRLHAVVQLSIELGRIRETTDHATRLAELAIESVIEGDWSMVEEWAEHFTFADEHEQLRQSAAPVFAVFHELLLQVLRTKKALPA